ncbi:hypothetical protein CYMTET_16432 [Cymbomonas tetramitiformis]|uniref:Uncharacterized protein n=1 Tax=Cymbomonas tetramitiformis TaxID=36881 RepID=A0AAE0GCL5_9CHLO|nr:hypothetical protein CYMTET_16432 [Cymbomonas tetramitiformis]
MARLLGYVSGGVSDNIAVSTRTLHVHSGFRDGPFNEALFYHPEGVTLDALEHSLYVADSGNCRIRKLDLAQGLVSTVAGAVRGFGNGRGTEARFHTPTDVEVSTDGTELYVADTWNHAVRKIVLASGSVTTLAGTGSKGFLDSPRGTFMAKMYYPSGLAVMPDGSRLFVADSWNSRIRVIMLNGAGQVFTLAGSRTLGYADGHRSQVKFKFPKDVAVSLDGSVSTVAGCGIEGHLDGPARMGRFSGPNDLTMGSDGMTLYLVDFKNEHLRRLDLIGEPTVTTVGAAAELAGNLSLHQPSGAAVSKDGETFFVSDRGRSRVEMLTREDWRLVTLAGGSPRRTAEQAVAEEAEEQLGEEEPASTLQSDWLSEQRRPIGGTSAEAVMNGSSSIVGSIHLSDETGGGMRMEEGPAPDGEQGVVSDAQGEDGEDHTPSDGDSVDTLAVALGAAFGLVVMSVLGVGIVVCLVKRRLWGPTKGAFKRALVRTSRKADPTATMHLLGSNRGSSSSGESSNMENGKEGAGMLGLPDGVQGSVSLREMYAGSGQAAHSVEQVTARNTQGSDNDLPEAADAPSATRGLASFFSRGGGARRRPGTEGSNDELAEDFKAVLPLRTQYGTGRQQLWIGKPVADHI